MRWWQRSRRKSVRGEARDAPGALRRALLAVLDRDLPRAEALLERAAELDSDDVVPYLALARLYRERGEIGRAIRLHQNLLLRADLDPEVRFEALLGLAGDFRRGGFLRRAIAAYEEALGHRPDHTGALRALVGLLADVRDYERALELARRLEKLEGEPGTPSETDLLVARAEAARAEGRSDEARRALKRVLRRDRRHVGAWIELGALEAERGRTRRALAAWRRVPELDRRAGPRVYPRLEAAYAAMERPRDYETYLRRLIEQDPDDAEARLALARALAARGEAEAALAEVRQVLERWPARLDARALEGRILLDAGRESEAAKAFGALVGELERSGPAAGRELFE